MKLRFDARNCCSDLIKLQTADPQIYQGRFEADLEGVLRIPHRVSAVLPLGLHCGVLSPLPSISERERVYLNCLVRLVNIPVFLSVLTPGNIVTLHIE